VCPLLHDGRASVPGSADRDAAAPPAVGRQSDAPNQHALHCCQQTGASDVALYAVRRRQLVDVMLLTGCRPLAAAFARRTC